LRDRFVEEDDPAAMVERPGDGEALAFAAAGGGYRPVQQVRDPEIARQTLGRVDVASGHAEPGVPPRQRVQTSREDRLHAG